MRGKIFAKMLKATGNRLADVPLLPMGAKVCLPPHSTLTVNGDRVGITNPFGSLMFEVVPSGGVNYIKPGSQTTETPTLADGHAQFETRVVGVKITNRKSAHYSQHRDTGKYEDWRKQVTVGLEKWFA